MLVPHSTATHSGDCCHFDSVIDVIAVDGLQNTKLIQAEARRAQFKAGHLGHKFG